MQFRSVGKQRGFTIVELLIVIVVIAILAAISIVAYNGIQDRANDSTVQNDLRNIASKIKSHEVINGEYPTGTADMTAIKLEVSKGAYSEGANIGGNYYNLVYCWPPANSHSFAVVAESKSGSAFAWVNGSVEKMADGQFSVGSMEICNNAGAPVTSGYERDWFYLAGNWQSYTD